MSYVLPGKRPSTHRRETGQGYLGAHSTYRPHIDLPVGSSWSREQQLTVHLEFFNSKFHSTIQSKRTQM
ncbi:unnamed protein product [Rotaria magnacalcarata]|uniref:Uncharacterized protein n=1 Tax=Rotaria magnacalcarata TaxID=392030 RepID=A0A815EJI2_9BILA|nr:unnamed protein product [Rotaria magnacalcarata]